MVPRQKWRKMTKIIFGLVMAASAHALECKKPDCFNESLSLLRKASKLNACQDQSADLVDALKPSMALNDRKALYKLESCLLQAKAAQKAEKAMASRLKRLNTVLQVR
jgi:hypothetical protein